MASFLSHLKNVCFQHDDCKDKKVVVVAPVVGSVSSSSQRSIGGTSHALCTVRGRGQCSSKPYVKCTKHACDGNITVHGRILLTADPSAKRTLDLTLRDQFEYASDVPLPSVQGQMTSVTIEVERCGIRQKQGRYSDSDSDSNGYSKTLTFTRKTLTQYIDPVTSNASIPLPSTISNKSILSITINVKTNSRTYVVELQHLVMEQAPFLKIDSIQFDKSDSIIIPGKSRVVSVKVVQVRNQSTSVHGAYCSVKLTDSMNSLASSIITDVYVPPSADQYGVAMFDCIPSMSGEITFLAEIVSIRPIGYSNMYYTLSQKFQILESDVSIQSAQLVQVDSTDTTSIFPIYQGDKRIVKATLLETIGVLGNTVDATLYVNGSPVQKLTGLAVDAGASLQLSFNAITFNTVGTVDIRVSLDNFAIYQKIDSGNTFSILDTTNSSSPIQVLNPLVSVLSVLVDPLNKPTVYQNDYVSLSFLVSEISNQIGATFTASLYANGTMLRKVAGISIGKGSVNIPVSFEGLLFSSIGALDISVNITNIVSTNGQSGVDLSPVLSTLSVLKPISCSFLLGDMSPISIQPNVETIITVSVTENGGESDASFDISLYDASDMNKSIDKVSVSNIKMGTQMNVQFDQLIFSLPGSVTLTAIIDNIIVKANGLLLTDSLSTSTVITVAPLLKNILSVDKTLLPLTCYQNQNLDASLTLSESGGMGCNFTMSSLVTSSGDYRETTYVIKGNSKLILPLNYLSFDVTGYVYIRFSFINILLDDGTSGTEIAFIHRILVLPPESSAVVVRSITPETTDIWTNTSATINVEVSETLGQSDATFDISLLDSTDMNTPIKVIYGSSIPKSTASLIIKFTNLKFLQSGTVNLIAVVTNVKAIISGQSGDQFTSTPTEIYVKPVIQPALSIDYITFITSQSSYTEYTKAVVRVGVTQSANVQGTVFNLTIDGVYIPVDATTTEIQNGLAFTTTTQLVAPDPITLGIQSVTIGNGESKFIDFPIIVPQYGWTGNNSNNLTLTANFASDVPTNWYDNSGIMSTIVMSITKAYSTQTTVVTDQSAYNSYFTTKSDYSTTVTTKIPVITFDIPYDMSVLDAYQSIITPSWTKIPNMPAYTSDGVALSLPSTSNYSFSAISLSAVSSGVTRVTWSLNSASYPTPYPSSTMTTPSTFTNDFCSFMMSLSTTQTMGPYWGWTVNPCWSKATFKMVFKGPRTSFADAPIIYTSTVVIQKGFETYPTITSQISTTDNTSPFYLITSSDGSVTGGRNAATIIP